MILRALAVAVTLASCSEPSGQVDSGSNACECPAAEAPLAGRIVTEVASGGDIAPNSTGGGTPAECSNPKAELLSGGCAPEDQTLLDGNLLLLSSTKAENGAVGPDGWYCRWQNKNGAKTAHIIVTLTCLNPGS